MQDTAQAVFDVEDHENYVRVQSESAVRHLASVYAYDHGEENEITLRSVNGRIECLLKQAVLKCKGGAKSSAQDKNSS